MKLVRPLLFTLVVVLALAGIACAVVLAPSFQRWAVLRAAAGQPGLKLTVDRVAGGFSHLALENVRVEHSGVVVQLTRLDADYALAPLLFSQRLQLDRVMIDGLLVDASRLAHDAAPATPAAAPVAVPGILSQLELPYAVVLTECRVAGRLLLPGAAGEPALPVEFQLSGGQFAPEQEGNLRVTATVKNPQPAAPVSQLQVQLNLRATQTAQRTFSQLALVAMADAEGPMLTGQNQLKLSVQLAQQAAGEDYTASIDTVTAGKSENLLALQATLANGASAYAGEWALKARTAQVQAYALGRTLPDFSATGRGKFSFAPATSALTCQGELQADVGRLETIDPAWRVLGPVKLDSQFDVALLDDLASVRRLDVQLAGAAPVLTVHAAPGVEFNLRERRLQPGSAGAGEVLTAQLHGLPVAWLQPFVTAVDLSGEVITGEWAVTAEKENLRLRTLQPLQARALTVVQAGQRLLEKADLGADVSADLAGANLTAAINRLTLKTAAGDALSVQGKVASSLADAQLPLTATLRYEADLPQLLAAWVPLGRVQASGAIEGKLQGDTLALQTLTTAITTPTGPLLTVRSLRAFTANLTTLAVTTDAKGSVDLMKIDIGRLPLASLPLTAPGDKLDGALERGEWMLSLAGDRWSLRALTALKLTGVALAQDNQPVLTGLAVEALPRIEVGPALTVQAQTGDIAIRTKAGATVATLKGDVTGSPTAGWNTALTFSLEVPQLATQPMFAGAQAVSAGRASGEIRGRLHDVKQVEARLTINGLVDRASGQTLPVANLSFQGVVEQSGRITLKAPLLLDQGGHRSDLQVALDLTPVGSKFSLAGRLSGDQVELADLLALSHVFASPDAAPAKSAVIAAPRGKVVADTQPAWAQLDGQLDVAIKSIHRGDSWAMTGLNGHLTIKPTRVALEQLTAAFGEKGRLAAEGEIKFTAGAQPYQAAGKFSVTEFDAGKLFKALDPAQPATVDGVFTVNGEFAGTGETLERLQERVHGRFALTSRQGVFRGLHRATSKVSKATKAVELASSLGSLLGGSESFTKAAEKVAGATYVVDQIAQELGELKYDQLSAVLSRDAALNLKLEDISLVSPEVRLIGRGTVTYVEGKSLLEQPLTASLSLAARGKSEQLLGKIGWIGSARDELGFAKAKEVLTLGGTLTKPDASAFFTRLATAKLTDYLGRE